MKRYKEEVDALHASDSLKAQIAELPQNVRPKKAPVRRIAAIAAVLVVVLIAGIAATPALFSAQKAADRESIELSGDGIYYENAYDSLSADGEAKSYGTYTNGSPAQAIPAEAAKDAAAALPSGRKLVRNAELSVQTKSFDEFHNAVLQKTAALQGYVESSESGVFSTMRYEYLTLRIPADSLDDFLQSVSELGTVISQETSVQDVTDQYIDVQSRLAALEAEQETLLALLKKAETLADVLEIQDRLTEVRGSLESYKAKLQALNSQIDYSKVSITVNEVERVTPQESRSFFTQVRQNLSENMYSIGRALRSFALWFLSSLPFIALWLIVIGVVVGVILLVRRRKRRK